MDQLPVELVIKIFAQACFDDNVTGCSLRLVSQWVSEVVEPIRFEAVSLYGLHQLTLFATMLEHLPPSSKNVNHLFISGISIKEAEERKRSRDLDKRKRAVQYKLIAKTAEDESWDDEDQSSPIFPGDTEFDYYRAAAECERKQTAFDDAFHRIVRQTAISMRTLFVTSTFKYSPAFPPFLMPNLTDFSVTSSYGAFAFPHPFPRLQRVHTDRPICVHDGFPPDFRINAPILEELRVTGIGDESGGFVADVIEHARCVETRERDGLLFPDTVNRIVLQQRPPPYGSVCGNAYIQHGTFTRHLLSAAHQLAKSEDLRVGFRLVVLEMLDVPLWLTGKISGLSYSFDDARKDWLDVISGSGKGAWNDSYPADYTGDDLDDLYSRVL